MAPRSDPKDDVWENVTDARKRKQIQDRLAQRARRQRLREAKSSMQSSSPGRSSNVERRKICACTVPARKSSPKPSPDYEAEAMDKLFNLDSSSSLIQIPYSTDTEGLAISSQLLSQDFSFPILDMEPTQPTSFRFSVPMLSPQSQPEPPQTVFTALYLNGEILELPCCENECAKSRPAKPNHPSSLHPTELQLTIVHRQWYDRIPFPRMRDNLIRMKGFVNDQELVVDLFTMPSWRIERKDGGRCVSWDPKCWVMEKEWAAKWGWLMI